MRVVYKAEGGLTYFPGLRQLAVLDSDNLSAEEESKIKQLLASARFFELPADCRSLRAGAADYRQYAITVEDADRRRTVRLADPVENPHLRALLEFVQHCAGEPHILRAPAEIRR